MKISIALSILILALAAGLGWHGHHQLAGVRESHAKLVAEAATLGISIDPAHPDGRVLVTKHAEREDKQAAARLMAAKFIAFAKELEALEKTGERPDEAMQKRIMEFLEIMMSLDVSELKILIAEVRAAGDLKDETRRNLIAFSIMTLADSNPQGALAIFIESPDLIKDGRMGDHVISMALGRWAKDDPMGALEWVRKNGEKVPDLDAEDAKRAVISGAATQDPGLALQLISELKLKDSREAVRNIADAAKTPEECSATLAAFREHAASVTDQAERERLMDDAITLLANSVAKDGFKPANQWIANAGLSPKELEKLSDNLVFYAKPADTGQWVEWAGKTLSGEKADRRVHDMVHYWTEKDYRAAGTWLANAADGPTKHAAIRSYAETVASYDPEAAAQWALTLPADEKRVQTLRRIHQQWPKDDAAGAAAFAEKQGIKP
jgi:hypothetical protein